MTAKTVIGIILIVIGIVSLGYQGFSYTTRKKVIDIGSLQATRKEQHTVPLPPIVGIITLAGGIVVLVAGRREA